MSECPVCFNNIENYPRVTICGDLKHSICLKCYH